MTVEVMTIGMIPEPDTTVITGAGGWLGTGLVAAFSGDGERRRAGRLRLLVHDHDDEARLLAMTDGADRRSA